MADQRKATIDAEIGAAEGKSDPMTFPIAFFGHGSPMNTLESNAYTASWELFAATLPCPRAVLVVSAHWYVPSIRVLAAARPPTIHDFGGFPRPLYEFVYPAPGSPELAERVADLLAPYTVERDATTWGIDHGAYSVLTHLFPNADIPVVQLSLDRRKPATEHYALARQLAPLRDEDIFILGSGNVVHNLEIALSGQSFDDPQLPWATDFEERMIHVAQTRDHRAAVDYQSLGVEARLAVPTPEHFLPFLYTLALARDDDRFRILTAGGMSALSMLAVAFGG